MNTELVPADALTPEHLERWAAYQRADATLGSPFFRPEYVQQVARLQPGVEVVVLKEAGEPVGFFAFERCGRHVGGPVGGVMCDFQGVVARPGTAWDAVELLRAGRLTAWHFHHLLASQEAFRPYGYCTAPSLYLDLARGFEAYHAERREAGSHQIRKTLQKARKVDREAGPLRFEPMVGDRTVLETLIGWKREHYRRIGAIDYLEPAWSRELLDRLLALRDPALSGVLSALYFGDRLAAIHFGVRSYETLHAWFPSYDPALESYSPGLLLFVKLAENANAIGIQRIDLGRGSERFKEGLGSAAVEVVQGSVDRRLLAGPFRRGAFSVVRWLRGSPLRNTAKTAVRLVPGLRRWASFH